MDTCVLTSQQKDHLVGSPAGNTNSTEGKHSLNALDFAILLILVMNTLTLFYIFGSYGGPQGQTCYDSPKHLH